MTVVGDVHAAAVNHAQEIDRAGVLAEDHLPPGVELDRRLRCHLGELVARQRVERGPLRQKACDLAQAGVDVNLRWTNLHMATETVTGARRAQLSRPRRWPRWTASVRLR